MIMIPRLLGQLLDGGGLQLQIISIASKAVQASQATIQGLRAVGEIEVGSAWKNGDKLGQQW